MSPSVTWLQAFQQCLPMAPIPLYTLEENHVLCNRTKNDYMSSATQKQLQRPYIVSTLPACSCFPVVWTTQRCICSEMKPTELIYHLNIIHAMKLRLKWILGVDVDAFQSFISCPNETVAA
jgi:hypothetical protein